MYDALHAAWHRHPHCCHARFQHRMYDSEHEVTDSHAGDEELQVVVESAISVGAIAILLTTSGLAVTLTVFMSSISNERRAKVASLPGPYLIAAHELLACQVGVHQVRKGLRERSTLVSSEIARRTVVKVCRLGADSMRLSWLVLVLPMLSRGLPAMVLPRWLL